MHQCSFSIQRLKALNFDNFDNSHNSFLWLIFLCERWIPCQALTSVLCLHYRPETVHCSTKDVYTSKITFLALHPCNRWSFFRSVKKNPIRPSTFVTWFFLSLLRRGFWLGFGKFNFTSSWPASTPLKFTGGLCLKSNRLSKVEFSFWKWSFL